MEYGSLIKGRWVLDSGQIGRMLDGLSVKKGWGSLSTVEIGYSALYFSVASTNRSGTATKPDAGMQKAIVSGSDWLVVPAPINPTSTFSVISDKCPFAILSGNLHELSTRIDYTCRKVSHN